ncbi:MAG: hypothetical protein A3B10_04025 [Candidatus Doudnabacteria bacterium RIFCSPLOWO2_01_FULL_44_21]|uniref:Uncharacterized protein n=1 Tax=Candidatus Doudnabacteria bacterium RIFCSPLOWO2_01_FULL_44_21 TaxID=1817841 RepID=A0A1F5Q573_9BACT|nr:MAG: hypothetical protein A3B95_00735 [Candidatus Doudnabacteria bacterium RIFCSPHIGHO2_02_FULL_43_13b]OGE97286.1 MAG: hypothetical protein A3B10_04025 [Candidatus Doudnabacteria bacterium RIFCSPLOWO2_01_FULL_44_21]
MTSKFWVGLVAVAIIVGLALVFWIDSNRADDFDQNYDQTTDVDTDTDNTTAKSDSAALLETDLNAINLDGLDAEAGEIETQSGGL